MAKNKGITVLKDGVTMAFNDHPPILRKDIYDSEWTDTKAVLITIMSIINVFMFFGNILSIVTICYTPKLRQQVSYWFVMNLAVIDFVISVTVVPINTFWEYYGTWPFSRATCEFFTFADISFSTISAYSIVLVSIDKYMYITYSIHYYDKMTRKTAAIMIIAVWIMVFIFATVSIVSKVGTDENFEDHFLKLPNNTHICVFVMTDAYVLPLVIFSFFVPFLILCFTTSRITCIASKHIKKIHAVTITIASETDSVTVRTSDKLGRPRRHTFNGEDEFNTQPKLISLRKGSSDINIYSENHRTISTIQEGKRNYAFTMAAEVNDIPDNVSLELEQSCSTVPTGKRSCTDDIKVLSISALSESKPAEHFLDATKTGENADKSLEMKKGPGSKNSRQTLDTINERKITYASFKEQTLENNASNNFPAKDPNQVEYSELSVTISNDEKKPSDCVETITKDRSGSTRSSRLPQTESIKSVLRKTSPYCKLFGTVTIVIICFILMFAPYNVATVIDVPCHCIEPWVYEDILAVLYYMHSLVNPYIYMATDRKYKAALKILWRRVKLKIAGLFRP